MPGAGGAPRKVTALRLLEGKHGRQAGAGVSHRPLPPKEPKPKRLTSPALPAHLRWLDPLAKGAWKRLAPSRWEFGLLTEWDCESFGAFCEALSRWTQAVKEKDRVGIREALVTMDRLGAKFGWTPGDRTRIQAEAQEVADEF